MKRTLSAALTVLATLSSVARADTAMTAGPSAPAGRNVLWNGTFDGASARPWSVGFDSPGIGRFAIPNRELCLQIAEPGPERGSVVVRQRPLMLARGHHYQLRLRVHATAATHLRARLSKIGAPYTELWAATAEVGTDTRAFAAAFAAAADDDNVELAIELGGPLAGPTPLTVCLDDVELNDP
ncbi:MAG TPA: carbohydrate binding domain-containing protein, partial [Polyangia bacterium]